MWIKGTGKIIYDPYRPGLKKNKDFWCVVDVDPEITRYYRYWVDKHISNPLGFEKKGLIKPAWDAHISVIRGETPPEDKMHFWKKYHGKLTQFEYSPCVKKTKESNRFNQQEDFWFVEVRSSMLKKIRDDFGFKSDWLFHITIGKKLKESR